MDAGQLNFFSMLESVSDLETSIQQFKDREVEILTQRAKPSSVSPKQWLNNGEVNRKKHK